MLPSVERICRGFPTYLNSGPDGAANHNKLVFEIKVFVTLVRTALSSLFAAERSTGHDWTPKIGLRPAHLDLRTTNTQAKCVRSDGIVLLHNQGCCAEHNSLRFENLQFASQWFSHG